MRSSPKPLQRTLVDAEPPEAGRTWIDAILDEAVLRCDHAGRILEVFGRHDLLPSPADELIGRGVADVRTLPLALRLAWSTALDRALDTQRAQICAYELERDGATRPYEARMKPLGPEVLVIAIRDVTERDRLRGQLEHHATHDVLTGLGNTRALRERLEAWLRPGVPLDRTQAVPVVLLIVDIDRFKRSNDLYGRSLGDSLLRLVALRMRREARRASQGLDIDAAEIADESDDPSIVVVRLGGDQFAIAWRVTDRQSILATDAGIARGVALAERTIAALAAPTRIAGQTLFVRASIGGAIYPDDAIEPSALFWQAEGALKRAKVAGRNQYRFHGDDDAPPHADSLPPNTESALRGALASNQFLLVYQPKFELATSIVGRPANPDRSAERNALVPGAIVAVEALVRWRTPSGALLIPHEFIPLAEASGMIRPLGDWVLRTALAEASRFAATGGARVGVALNVSLLQLHDRTFVRTVESALAKHGFEPGELTVELAETAFIEDLRLIADAIADLSALGVRLAIDHFGIGTAGLVALKSLPIDEIKIDRSFIAGSAIDAFDANIVAALVRMAHDLGKTVTAEGVERLDQVAALSQMRCDAIQGYFVGEPMNAASLVAATSLWHKTPGFRLPRL